MTVSAHSEVQVPQPVELGLSVLLPRRSATGDIASLLSDVPGASLQGAGGVSSLPSLRGLAEDRWRIKVDDMDLIASCPNHMYPALSCIDPTQLGTLKVSYTGQLAWCKLEARAHHETVDHFMDFGADKRFWYGMGSGGQ